MKKCNQQDQCNTCTAREMKEISSCCLQNVRTNSLVEDSINTCLRHVHMSSVMWARLQSTASSRRLMFPLAQSIQIFMITKKSTILLRSTLV